jgi:hypothetical protein
MILARKMLLVIAVHVSTAIIVAPAAVHAEAGADARRAASQVRFEPRDRASEAQLTLYRLKAYVNYGFGPHAPQLEGTASEYELVCTAPCIADLSPGTYQFALSAGTKPPVLALDGSYRLQGNETLIGHLDSQSTLRTAGIVLIVAGLASLIVTSVVAIHAASRDPHAQLVDPKPFPAGLVTAGLVGGGVLGLAGIWITAQPDIPELEVRPSS